MTVGSLPMIPAMVMTRARRGAVPVFTGAAAVLVATVVIVYRIWASGRSRRDAISWSSCAAGAPSSPREPHGDSATQTVPSSRELISS